VRKHAPGAPVWLTMVFGDEEVVLTVANGAPTEPPSALAESGGGYGLAGLKERAELIGGSLEAGPRRGGGGCADAGGGAGAAAESASPDKRSPDDPTPEDPTPEDRAVHEPAPDDQGWQVTLRLHG
jgi:hypothetical protein